MRRALAVLVAMAVLAGAIAALAPAALVGVALERASGGALTLAGEDGSFWRGRGTLVVARAVRLPLAWSIEALPLLAGELRLHVAPPTTAAATPTGEIDLRSGAVAVRAFEVVLPANLVTALAPRAGIRATGDLTMISPSLDWTASSFAGSARFSWQDARVAVGSDPGASLGNVDVALSAAGDWMTGPVTNVGGDLDIRGTVSVGARGASDVALALTPRGDNPALARQLAAIGAPDGPGWRVQFRSGQR